MKNTHKAHKKPSLQQARTTVAVAEVPLGMRPRSYQPESVGVRKKVRKHTSENLWQRKRKLWRTLIAVPLVALLLATGWIGWKLFTNASELAGGNALGFLRASDLNGEETGRVNVLLTGNSVDKPGHGGAKLTDSIMIVSIDVEHNSAYMLSIPRDFYVKIPGYGYDKINAAYVYGDRDGFSEEGYYNGGVGLLQKTLAESIGVKADHHVIISYTAFRDAVNAVGGIDVEIASSDPRGIFDPNINYTEKGPLKLSNGWHHIDGQTALNLARARNNPPPDGRIPYGLPRGDYDRATYQRKMLIALKERAFAAGTLSNPLKVGRLLDSFGNNMRTDMTTSQLRRLYDLFKGMESGNIRSLSLSDPDEGVVLIRGYATPNGLSAQIPSAGLGKYQAIREFITEANRYVPPQSSN